MERPSTNLQPHGISHGRCSPNMTHTPTPTRISSPNKLFVSHRIGPNGARHLNKWKVCNTNWWVNARRNSIANALELRLSCTNPSKCNMLVPSNETWKEIINRRIAQSWEFPERSTSTHSRFETYGGIISSCQTSNISGTSVGNTIGDHSAVVGASPVSAVS